MSGQNIQHILYFYYTEKLNNETHETKSFLPTKATPNENRKIKYMPTQKKVEKKKKYEREKERVREIRR